MTEADWMTSRTPGPMLDHLYARATPRKMRLFACACCWRIFTQTKFERYRWAIEASERYADGLVEIEELAAARNALDLQAHDPEQPTENEELEKLGLGNFGLSNRYYALRTAIQGSGSTARLAAMAVAGIPLNDEIRSRERQAQTLLLRDIFGNPFRPDALDPAWRTANVVGLAQSIYDERAFDRLPILADALEDAGCDNADILNHCRQPGAHVRGCWLVDLALGRE